MFRSAVLEGFRICLKTRRAKDSGCLSGGSQVFENVLAKSFFGLPGVKSNETPRTSFAFKEDLFGLEILETLFRCPLSSHDDARIKIEIESSVGLGERGFQEAGSDVPEEKAQGLSMGKGQIFEIDEAVEKRTIGEEVVITFPLQPSGEATEAEEVKKKKLLAEEEREEGGVGDGFFSTRLEMFFLSEETSEATDEGEFNRVKISHSLALTFELSAGEFELSGFAAAIHAGKGNVLHRLSVSKSAILSNDSVFYRAHEVVANFPPLLPFWELVQAELTRQQDSL